MSPPFALIMRLVAVFLVVDDDSAVFEFFVSACSYHRVSPMSGTDAFGASH